MKRTLIALTLFSLLLPAGLALRAQEPPDGSDLDRLIEEARKALAEKAAEKPKPLTFTQRMYDIRDLTARVHDFPGRSLNLVPSGGFGFGFFEEEEGEALPFYEGDMIVDMIREYVQPESWDELRSAAISYANGVLVVTHTEGVHGEIADFLGELRSRAASQITVTVRALRLGSRALQAILDGESAIVIGPAGEEKLASMIQAGSAREMLTGSVQCVNTQRVNLTELTRHAYLQDYDVEIAEGSSISDPIMQELEEGLVLDVRPILAGGGELVILEVRADLAVLEEPMGSIETPVGSIELPAVDLLRIRTTLATREGRSVIVGGTVSASDDGAVLFVLTPDVHRPGR